MVANIKESLTLEIRPAIDYWLAPGELKVLQEFTLEINKITDPEAKSDLRYTALYMLTAFHEAKVPPRDDGSPVTTHCLESANILLRLGLGGSNVGRQSVKDGLLHDLPEDTPETFSVLEQIFGAETSGDLQLISRVKKPDSTAYDEQERDRYLRQGLLTGLESRLPAFLARCAERLHNLRTIAARFAVDPESAKNTCRETLEVYLPPIEALGLRKEFGDEMGKIAIGLLYPEIAAKLDTVLPVFNTERRQETADNLAQVLEIGKQQENIMSITPPSYHNLWQLLKTNLTPEMIRDQYGANLAFDIDIVITDNVYGKLWGYLGKINQSGHFRISPESWVKSQHLKEYLDHDQPFSVIVGTNETGNVDHSFFRLTFLTADQLKEKRASLIDYLVSEDEELVNAGRNKLEEVRQMMQKVIGQDAARELEYIRARLQDKLVTVTYKLKGKWYEYSIPEGSCCLDLLADVLSEGDIIHVISALLSDESAPEGKRNILMNREPVKEGDEIDIDFNWRNITARPSWLDVLSPTIEIKRSLLKDIFRRIIDGEVPEGQNRKNIEKIREEISEDARERGSRIMAVRLDDKTLDLSVTHGFDTILYDKYSKEPYRFLVDVGIEEREIDEVTLEAVADRLNNFKRSLVNLTVEVPIGGDRKGWEANCSGTISRSGLNIVTSTGRGVDKQSASAEIAYRLQRSAVMVDDEGVVTVMKTLSETIKAACLEQLGQEPSKVLFELSSQV